MGGLRHLFYFHHGHKGSKHRRKGHACLDPPRNSLELRELPAETSSSTDAARDSEQDLPKLSYYPNDDSMMKLITKERSKRSNNRLNAPSVVARLMGVNLSPREVKLEASFLEDKYEDMVEVTDKKVQHVGKVSAVRAPKRSKSSSKKDHHSYKNTYLRYFSNTANFGKPVEPRVHPQEKELQKFKKEFEAWQAARFLECARVLELGNIPEQWLAQLDLTKEKMAFYETSRKTHIEKSVGRKTDILKSRSLHGGDFHEKEMPPAEHKESHSFSGRSLNKDFDQLSLKDSDLNSNKSSVPAKIVILKPGPDSFATNDESWVSSCSMEDRDHIEDLLEEVKKRLKSDMQTNAFRKGLMIRGSGIETPYKEKSAYMKEKHQHAAKQVKENPNIDLERILSRSESERSYQSETEANELVFASPKFMRRETRKFLSERLENVLNGEDRQTIPHIPDDVSRVLSFDDARETLERARDILNAETGRNHWQDMKYEAHGQARSFRHEFDDEGIGQEQPTPRNLVRSLSAPVSGTSFGKLLLEDRFISNGTHIKRKHEGLECLSPYVKGRMNEKSNFSEKVSNIKQSLSLRKKLFNRKFQSIDLSQTNDFDLKDIMSGPTILTRSNKNNENLTEVPPSPASICSSAHEEFWKPADNPSFITNADVTSDREFWNTSNNPSTISNSDVTSVGDQSVGNVFREISSNLTELRRQLNQLEYEGSDITALTEDQSEPEMVDVENEAEAYIKELLITSGLYDGSRDTSFSRRDPSLKPLSYCIFEKVEESYRKPANDSDEFEQSYNDDTRLDHKLLFDLLNEALSVILGPPRTLSKFRRKVTDITTLPCPQGRKVLERAWEMICEYVYPSMGMASYSLDDLVAHDIHIMPWSNLLDEEMRDLGKELEYQITAELVDDLVIEILQL